MTTPKLRLLAKTAIAGALASLSNAAPAFTVDYTMLFQAANQLDGPRDLGLAQGTSNDVGLFIFSPRVMMEFTPQLTAYVRGEGFVPTATVQPLENDQPSAQRPVRRFAALNEAYLQYSGLTNYPGEGLRVGRQLYQEDDGSWLGQNADSIRYQFDSTLLAVDLGIAHQFSNYRTDNQPLFTVQRHRTFEFLSVATDWHPENRIGLRALHAHDEKGLPEPGTLLDSAPKLQDATYTWVGLFAENQYFRPNASGWYFYHLQTNYLFGRNRTIPSIGGRAGLLTETNVGALTTQADLRLRPFAQFPVSLGLGYTYSQGGGKHQYEQSGLQANISNFTGGETLIYRYNDTLRPQLGNLHVVTAFLSWANQNNDAALVYNNFRKDDVDAPIVTYNVLPNTPQRSTDVGNGLDLVLTHFFDVSPLRLGPNPPGRRLEDQRTSLRLRASIFSPGAAFGPGTRNDYRVVLEGTLWID